MKTHRMTLFCASVAALALTQPAFAQDSDAADTGIGDIVVTAQKRAENVQDIPIAISAVSSEYLQARGIASIDTLGSVAPNVSLSVRLLARRFRKFPFVAQ
jgi:iron complex outermembrane recepter protein